MEDERPPDGSIPGMPGYRSRYLRPDYWFFTPPKRGWRRVVTRLWAFSMITIMVVFWASALR